MGRLTGTIARLRLAMALTVAVLAVELAGGLAAHSLALLSDAGHVLADVFALGLAWFAVEQSGRPADQRRSYGYQRVPVLAALLNSVVVIAIVVAISVEAIRRLLEPQPVSGGIVVAAALAGVAINFFVITMLRQEGANLNLRAVVLHVMGDIGAAVAVVAGGAVILLTGWLAVDPLLSLAIAGLIAYGAAGIVRETVNLLIEGTPPAIDLEALTEEITQTERVSGLHDLHVWALSAEDTALSCHVVIDDCPLPDAEHVVRDLEQRLCARFAIGHTTIQVESCHPCGEILHGAGDHNHPHPHEHAAFTASWSGRGPRSGLPHAEGSAGPPR